jgi:hypothetical protein
MKQVVELEYVPSVREIWSATADFTTRVVRSSICRPLPTFCDIKLADGESGSTAEIQVRDSAQWVDGTAISADDVIEGILSLNRGGCWAIYGAMILKVIRTSDRAVRIIGACSRNLLLRILELPEATALRCRSSRRAQRATDFLPPVLSRNSLLFERIDRTGAAVFSTEADRLNDPSAFRLSTPYPQSAFEHRACREFVRQRSPLTYYLEFSSRRNLVPREERQSFRAPLYQLTNGDEIDFLRFHAQKRSCREANALRMPLKLGPGEEQRSARLRPLTLGYHDFYPNRIVANWVATAWKKVFGKVLRPVPVPFARTSSTCDMQLVIRYPPVSHPYEQLRQRIVKAIPFCSVGQFTALKRGLRQIRFADGNDCKAITDRLFRILDTISADFGVCDIDFCFHADPPHSMRYSAEGFVEFRPWNTAAG